MATISDPQLPSEGHWVERIESELVPFCLSNRATVNGWLHVCMLVRVYVIEVCKCVRVNISMG